MTETPQPQPVLAERQRSAELTPYQRDKLILLMRPRGLLGQCNRLLPICEQLYKDHAQNYAEEWGDFQLGHLLAAARLEMLLRADTFVQKAQKKRFLRKTGLSEEYLRESLAYRLSTDILAYQPEFQVDDDITAAEAQPLEDQFLQDQNTRKQFLVERMRSLFPHFFEKSLEEEELIYMVMRDTNRDRVEAGLSTFSHSLDDVYLCRTQAEKEEIQRSFSGKDKLEGKDLWWVGKAANDYGVVVSSDLDMVDDLHNWSLSGNKMLINFLRARTLHHELAMHLANSPRLSRDLEGKIALLINSNSLASRTGFEQLIFNKYQPTGLMEAIVSLGEHHYAIELSEDENLRSFLGTRMSGAKLNEVLARSAGYNTLLSAFSKLLEQWANKSQLNFTTVWRPTFTLLQRGQMDTLVRMFNQQAGDAAGSFLATIAAVPEQGQLAYDFVEADQKGKIAIILRLVKEFGGVDVNVSPRLAEVWEGEDGLRQIITRELNPDTRILRNEIPGYDFLRRLARQRLLAGKIDQALPAELEDVRAREVSRRKCSRLTETMQSGVDTAVMIINGFFEEHTEALNPQIMTYIRESLAEDETGWEFVVQLKQAFSQMIERRMFRTDMTMELARSINDYLGGIIDSDLQDNPVEFAFGLFWALDEYQMALINQVQESLLKPIKDGPLVVEKSSSG